MKEGVGIIRHCSGEMTMTTVGFLGKAEIIGNGMSQTHFLLQLRSLSLRLPSGFLMLMHACTIRWSGKEASWQGNGRLALHKICVPTGRSRLGCE